MYFYGKTDIGKMRSTNQDNFLTMRLSDNVTMFVLCDGMGGTNGGNIASNLAIRTFADHIEHLLSEYIDANTDICDTEKLDFTAVLHDAVSAANSAVYSRAHENSELANMGTTIVAALSVDDKMYVANVGDSRMYTLEGECLTQLTHDHSYVQMLVDLGQITKEEAVNNPRKNILTRAVGTEPRVEADVMEYFLPCAGSYMLLCSDGLYNFLTEEELLDVVYAENNEYDEDDYEAELAYKTEKLVDIANANGGGDNITIILIKIL
ncbi:MAG: Stp1/IreP family PP2C-type Ser/Thr phosphatase [Clostridia bacterium]|nr:Stp1/IreP family PP2C-type Ser/Thr phosphatase [Clostridia bacterium]